MRSVSKIAISYVVNNIKSSKMIAALLMIIVAIYLRGTPITYYSDYIGYNVNIGLLAFIISDRFVLSVMFIAVVFIFSDMPFKHPKQYYMIVRMGKRKWIFAHLIYCIIISLFIMLVSIIAFLVVMRGHTYFSNSWGKFISSVPETIFTYESGIELSIYKDVLLTLKPAEALSWTMIMHFFILMLFASICITFNLLVNEYAGIIICGILVFAHLIQGFDPSFIINYMSPVDWISVNIIDFNCNSAMPDWYYPLIISIIIIAGLWIVNAIVTRKNSITLEKLL